MSIPKPVVLCILDGWGQRESREANAPALANTPTFDRIMATCPHATLVTFGPDVGLPKGQMGNSEVGHTNIGAGRVVAMDLGQIDLAIEDGSFQKNDALQGMIATLQETGGTAHVMGLVSDGGVHGSLSHIIAALTTIAEAGVPVQFHAVTDGRDVAPQSALGYFETLEAALPEGARIATVSGRYYAMDRDKRWERVQLAYAAMINAQGEAAGSAKEAVEQSYARGKADEFILPTVLPGFDGVKEGDGFFCTNFRADRAREILSAIGAPEFDGFETGPRPSLSVLLGMVEYSVDHNAFMTTCFPKQKIVNTLGEWVAKHHKTQFRLAETEKYPHVTFFLDGGVEKQKEGEDRFMPLSPKVATYDLQPEMSSEEVTEKFVAAIEHGYDLIVTNYANPDMVGHTGDLDAAIAACEAVDRGLAKVVAALEKAGGALLLTADHGNCETMVDPETGGPHTAHTTNLVPVALLGGPEGASLRDGRLADIAPTLLQLMGMEQPAEMTGETLIK
ncbi:2,3-bisphosphoglycerate-independent phosphoglycerate mutase [Pseudooceanicola sp. CBS1P-1]|uniref:2,3-bisphosphoglycerate-independent phosphoglycerate mutase n=1 Tax=Pseudooceanicola albus TaxID=2692189 RepID=A0A6L7GCD8_9RHOB|nr:MULTISPECIES: 2,3-bisphosphoglycerate-independent phosphoglycerate mutase [Pseudooceanicola]MBT9386359.1 2,3-bisphosphoglycerate-independent phosphoglycerate mutase [Pseudooceanicola endophyticus]MXN20483.1 2,3-bisphosphoglycerate-independent phosphoglycerate mutase [Pseudooceanicola albus]